MVCKANENNLDLTLLFSPFHPVSKIVSRLKRMSTERYFVFFECGKTLNIETLALH